MRKPALLCALLIAGVSLVGGQTANFQLNTPYQCPAETTFKILSCSGDMCQVETSVGFTRFPGESPRADIMALMPRCRLQTTLEAQAAALAAASGKDINGFSVREQVQVSTGQGWKTALIVAMNGNDYRVLLPDGSESVKLYPSELRRTGPLTARDRSLGQFSVKERVQFLMDGKLEVGEITATKGMDYEIQLSPNRFVWANGRVLLLESGTPSGASGVKPGDPPAPGLTRCAGAVEGRYGPMGEVSGLVIDFRSGSALVRGLNGNEQILECWTGGAKLYLHRPGQLLSDAMLIEVQSDGNLKTPLGDIAKKDANDFSIREQTHVYTNDAWTSGLIVALNGNDYRVRFPDGSEAVKSYPSEVRRRGPATERDRALGLFNLRERVQILIDGKVEIGEITAVKGMDYEIQISPDRSVKANGRMLLLPSGTAAGTSGIIAGTPPVAGLTRCGSGLEGRYGPQGGVPGMAIEIRSGNALVRPDKGSEHVAECWTGGGKLYLHRPGQPVSDSVLIEVQKDGSMKTPLGEISKK